MERSWLKKNVNLRQNHCEHAPFFAKALHVKKCQKINITLTALLTCSLRSWRHLVSVVLHSILTSNDANICNSSVQSFVMQYLGWSIFPSFRHHIILPISPETIFFSPLNEITSYASRLRWLAKAGVLANFDQWMRGQKRFRHSCIFPYSQFFSSLHSLTNLLLHFLLTHIMM